MITGLVDAACNYIRKILIKYVKADNRKAIGVQTSGKIIFTKS